MFDDESYGRQLREQPQTLPQVYAAWREDHLGEPFMFFHHWVERVTGYGLCTLLDQDGQRNLLLSFSTTDERDGPSPAALMAFEGLESGP